LQERFAESITERINVHSDDQLDIKALKQIDIQFLRFIEDINKLHYPFKDKELGMDAHRSKEEIIFRNESESFIPEAEELAIYNDTNIHNIEN
jgi:hypothetical protein